VAVGEHSARQLLIGNMVLVETVSVVLVVTRAVAVQDLRASRILVAAAGEELMMVVAMERRSVGVAETVDQAK